MKQGDETRSTAKSSGKAGGIGQLVMNRRSMLGGLGAAALGLIATILATNPLVTKFHTEASRVRGSESTQPSSRPRPVGGMRRAGR
jgi:hypothetical protein